METLPNGDRICRMPIFDEEEKKEKKENNNLFKPDAFDLVVAIYTIIMFFMPVTLVCLGLIALICKAIMSIN